MNHLLSLINREGSPIIRASSRCCFSQSEHYGLKYAPDLVLVTFCPNDVMDTALGWDAVMVSDYGFLITREAAALGKTVGLLYERSRICRILLSRYVAWRRGKQPQPREDEIFHANGFHEKNWQAIETEFARMSEPCRPNHARLVVVHLPPGTSGERLSYPASRLSEWCAHHQTHSNPPHSRWREGGIRTVKASCDNTDIRVKGFAAPRGASRKRMCQKSSADDKMRVDALRAPDIKIVK
jgi:hypothetical protein